MTESCDVLISGAGPVGATLALALHAQGRRVHLIDCAAAGPEGDDRSLGLTTGTVRFLERLGLWPLVAGAEWIRSLHISERGRFGRSHIRAADHGLDALGAVVPAQSLHDALAAKLVAVGLPVHRQWQLVDMPLVPARVEAAELNSPSSPVCYAPQDDDAAARQFVRQCVLQHADGSRREVQARLVVGADGVQSAVRTMLGIDMRVEPYRQIAIVSQLQTGKDVNGCAYERFSAAGPMAVMPRGARRAGMIWMVDAAAADPLLALSDADFAVAFQDAFGWRLGKLQMAAPRLRWPLTRMRASRLTAPRALLMGNAAGAFHPIAAQSFNLAMRDAQALCAALQAAADPGGMEMLAFLEQSRRADHDGIERMTDGLVKAFTQRLPVISQLRSLGLLGVELARPLQGRLVRRSAGTEEVVV